MTCRSASEGAGNGDGDSNDARPRRTCMTQVGQRVYY